MNYLDCNNNQLTFLDISTNTILNYLYCHDNQLTSLDISTNTILNYLYCHDNQLTSLDVSTNTILTWLYCNNNQLTSLDVSTNTILDHLDCHDNQLTQTSVDKILLDLVTNGKSNGNVDLSGGTNAGPSSIDPGSDYDILITIRNWTVTVNMPPSAPYSLNVSSGSAILTWESSSNNQDYFSIRKSITGVEYSNLTSTVLTAYTDADVISSIEGNSYWYKVAAINEFGTSSFSNTSSITFITPLPPQEEDMPLDSAVYSSGSVRDLIYGVQGDRVYKFNATDGSYITSSRFTQGFGPSSIVYASNVDKVYVAAGNSIRTGMTGVIGNGLVQLNADTLLVEGVFFNATQQANDYINDIFYFDGNIYGVERYDYYYYYMSYMFRFNPTTNAFENYNQIEDDYHTGGRFRCTHVNIPSGDYAGDYIFAGLSNQDYFHYALCNDVNNYYANYIGFSEYVCCMDMVNHPITNKLFILGQYPESNWSLITYDLPTDAQTYIDISTNVDGIKQMPFNIKYDSRTDRIYIPLWGTDEILVLDPYVKLVESILTGFDRPYNIISTPTKIFAVQQGAIPLKEIVYTPRIKSHAGFTYTTSQLYAPYTASFTNTSVNSDTYLWDFGDGSPTTSSVNPEHIYEPGIYNVILQASNPYNSSEISSSIIATMGPSIPNLVINPGFETGDLTGWTQSGDTLYTEVISRDPDWVHSGTYGLQSSERNLGYISQILSTTPGATYLISIWLDTYAFDTYNFVIYWDGVKIYHKTNPIVFGWKNIQVFGIATTTSTEVKFGFSSPNHYWGIDDISVAEPNFTTPATVASFTYTTSSLTAPFTAAFTNTSNNATQFTWSFGDGTPEEYSTDVSHVYDPGIYTVSLQAIGSFTDYTSSIISASMGEIASLGPTLVTNGGFDTGDLTGWTPSTNLIDGVTYSISNTNPDLAVCSGSYSFYPGGSGALKYISQSLATTPGKTYLISFYIADGLGRTPNKFTVDWNGITVINITSMTQADWHNMQIIAGATNTATELKFGFSHNTSFFGFDEVSASLVTWA